jgi:hypothetical protein
MLLLHANEVTSTDSLIDESGACSSLRTATATLQNASLGCGGSSAAASIETRAPGYLLHAPDATIDASGSRASWTKRELHEQLAPWLAASWASKEVIGFHLEQMCLNGNRGDVLRREASTTVGEAAEEATWSLDTAAAVALFRRAVALVPLRRPLEIELGYALTNEGSIGPWPSSSSAGSTRR